jgi:hypothetical protein
MTYTKPQLLGYSAIAAIQETGNPVKINDLLEPPANVRPSDPAYQADE